MPVLTQRRETQIVAFLLLFFLAHFALAEECKQGVQADVRYSCDLLNLTKGSVAHWDNWSTGAEACADVNGPERLFSRFTAAVLRPDFTFAGQANEVTLPSYLNAGGPGNFVVGLMVERKSRMTAAVNSGEAGAFDLQLRAFISKTVSDDQSGVTAAKEVAWKTVMANADSLVRTTGTEYTDSATQTTLHLHCAVKVRDGR